MGLRIVAGTGVLLLVAFMAVATEPPVSPSPSAGHSVGVAERPEGEPIFFRWLDQNDPVDATILEYWKRYESGDLSPKEVVDLGTMLYERGWPKDAVRLYKEAGKADPALYDAWLRAGLVEHSQRNLGAAKKYYKKCLKVLVGNGWCNFYMGLAEEQSFNGSAALKYYRKAFKVAPELSDPRSNPAVLQSRIAQAAALATEDENRFVRTMPMSYLEPEEVETTRARYESRQRKIQMWEAQAAGARQGASRTHAPPSSVVGAAHGVHEKGATVHPKPASPGRPATVSPKATPQHRPDVSLQRRTPPSTVPHRVPTPQVHTAPTPPPAGAGKVYPWGGGPLPPPVAPGQPPVAKTPAPKATPVPEKKTD